MQVLNRAILGAEERGFFLNGIFEHFLSLLFGRGPLAGLLLHGDQLPLFRHATGVCLRIVSERAIGGENRAGEPGYVHIVDCQTGAEGPGMSVEVGWSKDPNAKVNWAGGPVSGVIAPDRQHRMRLVAASSPPGLEPSKVPDVTSVSPITPAGHRGYAATWFGLAVIALITYALAVRKRWKQGTPRQ